MSPTDDNATAQPGRVLSGRAATLGGIALGVLLVVMLAAVMVVGGEGAGEPTEPPHDHDHVEVDPLTDRPVVDPCVASPDMCGEGAGTATEPCDDPSMCGQVIPDAGAEEIDAGSEPCAGELCGDIGPGRRDDTAP